MSTLWFESTSNDCVLLKSTKLISIGALGIILKLLDDGWISLKVTLSAPSAPLIVTYPTAFFKDAWVDLEKLSVTGNPDDGMISIFWFGHFIASSLIPEMISNAIFCFLGLSTIIISLGIKESEL